jgi:hypothetical protein
MKNVPVLDETTPHEDVWRNGNVAANVLSFDTTRGLVVSFAPQQF